MAGLPHISANPVEALIGLASGHWVSRAIWAAARLRIADAIPGDPMSLARIAAATGCQEDNLRRLMNALVSIGVFRQDGDDLYAHGELSPFLRSDNPISQRAFIDAVFGGPHYDAWGALDESVRSGTTAFDHVFGKPAFAWFSENPDHAELFSRAMASTTKLLEAALTACWAPPHFQLAVDVGGSRGTLVTSLLARKPEARGILFDLPDVVESVRPTLTDGRVEAVGGSFFENVPEGDLYLLKLILHDWTDEQSETILRNIRAAIRPGGHLAIIETVLPDQVAPVPGYLMDLNMMVMTGGRERTGAQFEALLERTGFQLENIVAMPLPLSVVQAVAV